MAPSTAASHPIFYFFFFHRSSLLFVGVHRMGPCAFFLCGLDPLARLLSLSLSLSLHTNVHKNKMNKKTSQKPQKKKQQSAPRTGPQGSRGLKEDENLKPTAPILSLFFFLRDARPMGAMGTVEGKKAAPWRPRIPTTIARAATAMQKSNPLTHAAQRRRRGSSTIGKWDAPLGRRLARECICVGQLGG